MKRILKIAAMFAAILVLASLMFDARNALLRFVKSRRGEPAQASVVAGEKTASVPREASAKRPEKVLPPSFPLQIDEILLSQKPGSERMESVLSVFKRWVRQDAEGAMDWAENSLEGRERLAALREGIGDWARRDLAAAALWAAGLSLDRSQTEALESLMSVWGERAPQEAALWLLEQPPNAASDQAARTLARIWGQQDFSAAANWARRQIELGEPTPGGLAVIRGVAQANAPAAALWALSVKDLSGGESAMQAVIEVWAGYQPAQAAQFIAETGAQTPGILKALASQWAGSDAVAASQWLQGQPQGAGRDAAIDGFARALVPYDAQGALVWALSVSDAQARTNLTRSLMEFWMSDDPAAAAAFARAHALEAEE